MKWHKLSNNTWSKINMSKDQIQNFKNHYPVLTPSIKPKQRELRVSHRTRKILQLLLWLQNLKKKTSKLRKNLSMIPFKLWNMGLHSRFLRSYVMTHWRQKREVHRDCHSLKKRQMWLMLIFRYLTIQRVRNYLKFKPNLFFKK